MRRWLVLLVAVSACSAAAPALALAAPAPVSAERSLTRALAGQLRHAGRFSGAYVLDLDAGRVLYARRAETPLVPASVEKLFTTAAALLRLGPEATFDTTVSGTGALAADGRYRGDLYLRGGGDPTFGSAGFARRVYGGGATVTDLAEQLAAGGIRRVDGRIYGDESLFDGYRGVPSSGLRPSSDVAPLSALSFDRGRAGGLRGGPPAYAATQLAVALRAAGVRVRRRGGIRVGPTPPGTAVLARVSSPPITRLIRLTNVPSDNFVAEMLLKDLGARAGQAGTTARGAGVVRAELARLGVRAAIVDGSGLSRANRASAHAVVDLLERLEQGPLAAPFTASLAVAGRSGTLAGRMRRTAAQRRCRGKTGTLVGVSNLAGYCTARDGHTLAFAFLMNAVSVPAARRMQDRMAVALARYDSTDGTPPALSAPPALPSPVPTGGAAPIS